MMRNTSYWVVSVVLVTVGCGSSNSGGSGAAGTGGSTDPLTGGTGGAAPQAGTSAAPIPGLCASEIACSRTASVTPCPSGYDCNDRFSPPKCVKLYCGIGGDSCAASVQCSPGFYCSKDTGYTCRKPGANGLEGEICGAFEDVDADPSGKVRAYECVAPLTCCGRCAANVVGKAGDPCGNACRDSADLATRSDACSGGGTPICSKTAGATGQPYTTSGCGPGLVCMGGGMGNEGTCQSWQWAGVGQTCGGAVRCTGEELSPAAAGCFNGKCKTLVRTGGKCDATTECVDPGNFCNASAVCQFANPIKKLLPGTSPPYGTYGGADIAVDEANVYAPQGSGSTGSIVMVPKNGGGATTIADAQSDVGPIIVDAENVYWTTTDSIMKAPKTGGAATVLAVSNRASAPTFSPLGNSGCSALAVDQMDVYWCSAAGVMKVAKTGAGGASLFAPYVGDFAIDNTAVYWVSADTLVTTPKAQVTSGAVVNGGEVAWDGTGLYYLSRTSSGYKVMKAAKAGGPAVVVTDVGGIPHGIAIDDTRVVYTCPSVAEVSFAPKSGGPSVILPFQGSDYTCSPVPCHPFGVAVSSGTVYWVSFSGVYRVDLPH